MSAASLFLRHEASPSITVICALPMVFGKAPCDAEKSLETVLIVPTTIGPTWAAELML